MNRNGHPNITGHLRSMPDVERDKRCEGKPMATIHFNLGALAPHIGEQLPMLCSEKAKQIEGHRQAINRLRINSILTPAEAKKAEERLVKDIFEAIQ